MSDDQLDDLKQFIDTTVGQSEARIKDDVRDEMGQMQLGLKSEIKAMEQRLTKRMDDGFAGVADAQEIRDQEVDERLTKLEQSAA